MAELAKGIQTTASAIGERLKEGPRTLNELRDWWVGERKGDAGDFREAMRYLLRHELVEARNLGGSGTKMVALPGEHHKPKGSGFVAASTAATSPPPVPPPASPRPPTPAPSPANTSGGTLNVGPPARSPDLAPPASPPSASPSAPVPPASAAQGPGEWMTTPEVSARLDIGVKGVPGSIADYQKAAGVTMRFQILPGKGRPRAYAREDVEAWAAWRATRPNVIGAAKRHGRPTPVAAAIAADVARSNAHRQAIDEALPAGPPGPADVRPQTALADAARRIWNERQDQPPAPATAPVLRIMVAPQAAAHLARMLKTGLYGRSVEDIAAEMILRGIRRSMRFVNALERGRR